MVFGWARNRGKNREEKRKEELRKKHPFDRAPTEILDELDQLRKTTDELEEAEERREFRDKLRRLND